MTALLREWGPYLLRRLAYMLLVLLGVSSITFVVTRLIGNPVYLIAGMKATPEMVASITKEMGLDKPLWQQYASYLWSVAQGDLGTSRYTFHPVLSDFMDRFPATLELSTFAAILGVAWCIPVGVISAVRRGGFIDRFASNVVNQIGLSIPGFWLGLLLIYLLYFRLQVLPAPMGRLGTTMEPPPHATGLFVVDSLLAGDFETLKASLLHLLLPAFTLAVGFSPPILQLTRDTVLQILQSDFIRTARAFGLPAKTVYLKYALKHAIPPVATSIAFTYGWLLSGTVLIETVFAWPGIGLYAVEALNHLDYEPIVGLVLISAGIYVVVFFITDMLQFALDPRLRTK
jgi:peptide/nickel transport system permease protein